MSVIGPVQSRYHEGITIYWQKIYVFPRFYSRQSRLKPLQGVFTVT